MAIESVVLFTSSQIGTLNATGAEFIVDRACDLIPVEREWVEIEPHKKEEITNQHIVKGFFCVNRHG